MVLSYLIASPFLFAQSNDHFANRALLTGSSISVTADNSAATTEPGEPINTNVIGKTLWWTWTAPTNGWVNVDIVPQPNDRDDQLRTMLWRGNSLTQLTLLATVTNDSPRSRPFTNACPGPLPCRPPAPGNVYVLTGQTLQLSVAANYRAGPFTLTLDLSTLELTSPAHDVLLAGPTNLVARISAPNANIEGNIRNLAFHYFWTNTGFGGVTYEGFREATNGLEATFGLGPSDYWFYARAVNEAGRILTTPSRYVRVRPRNDHFHEATRITTLPFDDYYNLYNSTGEPNEPTLSNQVTSASVWWRWTAPSNCQAIVRAFAPIGIFTGAAVDSLLPHALGSNSVRANFQAGTTYFFKVASHSSSLRISQSFQLDPYPANDDFANRTVLVGSSLVQYADSTVATSEPLEPPGSARSLWWSWTAPTNGLLNIRSVMFRNVECSVWTGDSLTNLVHVTTETFGSYLPDPWPPTLSYTILRCEVETGQTYHLRFTTGYGSQFDFGFSLDLCTMQITKPVPGLFYGPTNMAIGVTAARPDIEGTATSMMVGIGPGSIHRYPGSYATPLSGVGPFTGTITNLLPGVYSLTAWGTNSAGRLISTRSVPVRVAPWNDNFASAPSISGWVTNEPFWVGGSSTEDGEPAMDGQTNTFSVWWKWTATSNSTVLIRSHVAPIAVFEGDSLASLRPIGSRLPYAVRLDAVATTTYYIRAADDDDSPGLLNIGPLLANDDFANSILLAGDNATFLVTNSHTSIEPREPFHLDNNDRLRGSLWWHWIAGTNGLLLLQPLNEATYVEVFSGGNLANLTRQVAVDEPAFSFFDKAYRVRPGEQFNFAFDGTYSSTNCPYRLRFIPDPPPRRLELIRLSPYDVCFVSQAEVGEEITIEFSYDLEYWFSIDSEVATKTAVYRRYHIPDHDSSMFFRVVRRPPSAR